VNPRNLLTGTGIGYYSRQDPVDRGHLFEEVDHPARLARLLVWGRGTAAGQLHGVAKDLFGLPSRIDVVAHVGHAVGSEKRAERGQQRFLHRRGHPAVDAVGDDEIELAHRS